MILSHVGLSLFSQNKKAETSDGASDIYFDTSKFCLQVITFKKNTVLRTYIKIVFTHIFV